MEKAAAKRLAEENAAALALAAVTAATAAAAAATATAAAAALPLPTHMEQYTVEDSTVEAVKVDRADLCDGSMEEGDTGIALESQPMDLADNTIA